MNKFNCADERIIETLEEIKEEIKQKNSSSITQGYIDSIEYTVTLLNNLKYKLENGTLIELPCKVGDTVYVIPSLTVFRLNVLHGLSENNRVCEQKVHSVQMWNPVEWSVWTSDGIALLLQRNYKKTWFLTKEEAEKALERLNNE